MSCIDGSEPKRSLHDNGSRPRSKKSRTSQPSQDYVLWKMWILQNYEFKPSSTTRIADVFTDLSRSFEGKERSDQEERASMNVLGKLVKEIWKDDVKRVKRGPRGNREAYYLNLTRKIHNDSSRSTSTPCPTDHNYAQTDLFDSTRRADLYHLKVPDNWSIIYDREEAVSFVRLEHYLANNQRAVLEVAVRVQEGRLGVCTVRANGSAVDLKLDQDLGLARDSLSLNEQICHVLLTVEHSQICKGYGLPSGEEVVALLPHHVQQVRDLTKLDDGEVETRAFSDDCLVLLTSGQNAKGLNLCASCSQLKRTNCVRKRRISKRSQQPIHLKCNKRYLEKSEIEDQLQAAMVEKRKALTKAEYWKKKFRDKSIEYDSEDHQSESDNVQEDVEDS